MNKLSVNILSDEYTRKKDIHQSPTIMKSYSISPKEIISLCNSDKDYHQELIYSPCLQCGHINIGEIVRTISPYKKYDYKCDCKYIKNK